MKRSRKITYTDKLPARIRRLFDYLNKRYGSPEGYGISFYLDREPWGHTWRCIDRNRLVSMDCAKYEGGKIEALLTIHRT